MGFVIEKCQPGLGVEAVGSYEESAGCGCGVGEVGSD